MAKEIISEAATTYDDWELNPGKILRDLDVERIDLRTPLTKYESPTHEKLTPDKLPTSTFVINTPLLSAPMQSVTGPEMAIELAKQGGLGVIFCSQPIESQAAMVRKVKRHKAGFVEPDVVSPGMKIGELSKLVRQKGYDTFPVTESGNRNGRLLGLITGNDFDAGLHGELTVYERMVPIERLHFAYSDDVRDSLKEANLRMIDGHHGSMPIIDRNGNLLYVVFRKDVAQHKQNPNELVDGKKRYLVGAATNTHDYKERIRALVDAGVDILFVDSSQGYSEFQADTLNYSISDFPEVPIIGGNIVTEESFDYLVIENGAQGIKIGMGPGSICTTRFKFKMGRAQATAVMKVAARRDAYFKETGIYIPLIADGGIVTDNHLWIALAMNADAIMAGRYFARFHESPTPIVPMQEEREGRMYVAQVKPYWGEGSDRACAWMENRYGQFRETEGIEGVVPYAGHLQDNLPRTLTNMKEMLRRTGSTYIAEFHANTTIERQSQSSLREARPHDVSTGSGFWAPYSVE